MSRPEPIFARRSNCCTGLTVDMSKQAILPCPQVAGWLLAAAK